MKIFKKLILLSIIFLITSCGTLKEGFSNQKKKCLTDLHRFCVRVPFVCTCAVNELVPPRLFSSPFLSFNCFVLDTINSFWSSFIQNYSTCAHSQKTTAPANSCNATTWTTRPESSHQRTI